MSDDRLRELERRWRASGDLDDEVALVHERLRVGALDDARVRLAAGLGRAAALTVVGPSAPLPVLDRLVHRYQFEFEGRGRERWNAVNGADRSWRQGQAALSRIAAAAARAGLRAWDAFAATRRDLGDERAQALADLRALVRAVTAGEGTDPDAVDEVVARMEALADRDDIDADDEVHDALNAVRQLASFVADALGPGPDDEDALLAITLRDLATDDPAAWCVALAMNATSREEVEAAVRRDVGDWALGHGDPLREWVVSG